MTQKLLSQHTATLTLRDHIIVLAEAFAKATGKSIRQVSTMTFNDHNKIPLIMDGADLNTRSYEKALQIFSDNWPSARWPAGIKRPQKTAEVA